MRWLRNWFGSELAALEASVTRLAAKVDRLEEERAERWATLDAAVDKLIRRVRQRNRSEQTDESASSGAPERHPLTGAPLDPISLGILRRRNGG